MKKILIDIINKMIYGKKSSERRYINYLKNLDIEIGENLRIYDPINTTIDIQNPYMLKIGNDVRITSGVKILTHDYSYSVAANKYGNITGVGEVNIGNNVFIGVNAIILKDTTIGNNVIIGAGSIVHGQLENDSVYAGNPAKKIMTIEEYNEKNRKKSLNACVNIYRNYYKKYNKRPERKCFKEYCEFYSSDKLTENEKKYLNRIGSKFNITNKSIFDNYEQFIEYIEKEIKNEQH